MATQFITNDKGERTSVIVPIAEYEELLHQRHLNLQLSDEYKSLMDSMLDQENNDTATYVSYQSIKDRFQSK